MRHPATDSPLRIAILAPTDFTYSRDIVRGLLAAPEPDRDVEFRRFPDSPQLLPALAQWRPHAAVAYFPQVAPWTRILDELKIPTVNIGNPPVGGSFPRVGVDDVAIGAMGAEYFLARGFRQLGYVHYPQFAFSRLRWEGFSAAAERAGCPCHDHVSPRFWEQFHIDFWSTLDQEVAAWLQNLPKPLGILAANDLVATHVVQVCRRIGISVPDQVAVVGVDNDELDCLASHPPLSSIQLPTRNLGEETYAMLRQLLAGVPLASEIVLLPPVRVITRPSSETLALTDAEVAEAVRFIHTHAETDIAVKDVVKAVQISRRALEIRFMRELGCSPLQEIRKSRMEMAKKHLLDANRKVAEVARLCGFADVGNFTRAFRAHTRLTPAAYRRTFQDQTPGEPKSSAKRGRRR